jgi:hypothetical protein
MLKVLLSNSRRTTTAPPLGNNSFLRKASLTSIASKNSQHQNNNIPTSITKPNALLSTSSEPATLRDLVKNKISSQKIEAAKNKANKENIKEHTHGNVNYNSKTDEDDYRPHLKL